MKGFWIYLKLGEPVPTDEIEVLNRGLEALLGADRCHNRDRLARLPGSIHQLSGKHAEVEEFSGLVYEYADLAFLNDLARSPRKAATGQASDATTLLTSFPKEFAVLSDELWLYIERTPRWGEYGYDRSRMEQKIFTALVYQDWTDDEIITFATHYRLPRHLQEWMRHQDYRWTERSLRKAREHAVAHPKRSSESSTTKTMCIGSDTNG